MFTVPIPPAPFDRGRATALVAQKKIAADDTGWSYWITAKQATTRSNDTQAKMNMFAPARPKADSTTPASVEQATDSFTQKRAPGIPTATADAIPSFEDQVIHCFKSITMCTVIFAFQKVTGLDAERTRVSGKKAFAYYSNAASNTPLAWAWKVLGLSWLEQHKLSKILIARL
jgi:hypothetical protein